MHSSLKVSETSHIPRVILNNRSLLADLKQSADNMAIMAQKIPTEYDPGTWNFW